MLLFERIPAGGRHIGIENGELAERSKAHDWKSCIRQKPYLGFKSLALRHSDFNYNRASMLRGTRCRPPRGGVAERLNAAVSKTVRRVIPVSRVRIPPPPPLKFCRLERIARAFLFSRRRRDSFSGVPPCPWARRGAPVLAEKDPLGLFPGARTPAIKILQARAHSSSLFVFLRRKERRRRRQDGRIRK